MAQGEEGSELSTTRSGKVEDSFQAFLNMDIGADGSEAFRPAILDQEANLVKEISGIRAGLDSYERKMQRAKKDAVPTRGDHLSYLILLVPALLIIFVLLLHMSELNGWGLNV